MNTTIEEVITLYIKLHGREPSEEEREKLERKLGFGLVLEPDWEQLARPTGLGPSWLGLLWLLLDTGPLGEHTVVVAALEWLRGAHRPRRESPAEQRWHELTRAVNMLVASERKPRVGLVHSLRITEKEGVCYQCDMPVGPGLVGWYTGKAEGPLCPLCLRENAPSLSMLANSAVHGLPVFLRERRRMREASQ